jgi:hypothetical protein
MTVLGNLTLVHFSMATVSLNAVSGCLNALTRMGINLI